MSKIDILYHFNDKYAVYAGISLTSLFEHNRHLDMRIFILGEEISYDNYERFMHLAEIYQRKLIFLDTQNLVTMMQNINLPNYRGSYAANMRLFVAKVIPDDVKRLIYFDSDTIIVDKIDELVEMEMQDYPVAMVIDSLGFEHKKDLGISGNYYNTGMIVYQMDVWRRKQYNKKIIEHVKKIRSHYPMPDQDLLNIVCENKILTLSPKYNLQPVHVAFTWRLYSKIYRDMGYYSEKDIEDAIATPVVYHFFRFCGEFPWNKNCVHPDAEIFEQYLRISPWKEYEKKAAELCFPFIIEKILYRFSPKWLFLLVFKYAHDQMVHKANAISLKNEVYGEL